MVVRGFSWREKKISYLPGQPEIVQDTKDVTLRGLRLKGNYEDLPNMIFFTDLFDTVESWMPFFMNEKHRILDSRNVYIVNPRNFGLSDRCDTLDDSGEAVAADVERFMYQHKITMATVGGHGLGAKNALLAGCYRSHLLTGILALDYAPQDYQYFEIAHSYRAILDEISELPLEGVNRRVLDNKLESIIQNPKLLQLFKKNLKQTGKGSFAWSFNLDFVKKHFNDLVSWKSEYGLYTGRSRFVFPEFSNHVFLGSNTLAMHKICISSRGYQEDIFSVRTETDNVERNHWIYEDENLSNEFARLSLDFLQWHDGVDTLLKNRHEIYSGATIQTIPNNRKDQFNGEVRPGHLHHNWRYRNEESA